MGPFLSDFERVGKEGSKKRAILSLWGTLETLFVREILRVPWTWRWTRFFNADFSHSTCVLVFILGAGDSDQG